jgi:hypothetical protein
MIPHVEGLLHLPVQHSTCHSGWECVCPGIINLSSTHFSTQAEGY